MYLSIVCVTKLEPFALPFLRHMEEVCELVQAQFVVAIDGVPQDVRPEDYEKIIYVQSKGYVESVLDEAIAACDGDYVLRLDDDEKCSPAMVEWLREREYLAHDHWKFCTANLWRDSQSVPLNPPLWPDHHTRLSTKAKSGGRPYPHSGSPFGGGVLAPVIHEHHKFLVKSYETRRALARHYEHIGALIHAFTIPESCFELLTLAQIGRAHV